MRLFSVFLLASLAALAVADPPPAPWTPKGYVAYHLSDGQHITIDGRLDEDAWTEVGTTAAFGDIQGPFPVPRFTTTVKMRWDDDYLYVGAYMQETQVWANQTQRDSVVYYDNDFEIFCDPDGSTHYYKEFEMNAINTIWALYLTKPYLNGGTPVNYDSLDIKTAVYVDGPVNDPSRPDVFWTTEVALSLKDYAVNTTARTPPQQGDQWRINFSRVEWKVTVVDGKYEKVPKTAEDNWVWSPQYAINMHIPERWGYVLFSKEEVNATVYETPIDWDIRLGLMNVYEAEAAFAAQNGYFTDDFDQISSFIPEYVFSGQLGITKPDIYLPSSYSFLVTINGTTPATSNLMGTVRDDRYTRVVSV